MKYLSSYKAETITMLITSLIIFAIFSIRLNTIGKCDDTLNYNIEQEFESQKEWEKVNQDNNYASTNKAFNEDKDYKATMAHFKILPTNDFEHTVKALKINNSSGVQHKLPTKNLQVNHGTYESMASEIQSYKTLQKQLRKYENNRVAAAEHAKSRSSLVYALTDRIMQYYDTPQYLCEQGGTIVINITVNGQGSVTKAVISNASNSSNYCLVSQALIYAKNTKFNRSNNVSQIGTITFTFDKKR